MALHLMHLAKIFERLCPHGNHLNPNQIDPRKVAGNFQGLPQTF